MAHSNCNFLLAHYLLTKFIFSALALKKDIGGWPLGPPPPIPFHSKPVTHTHAEPPPTQIYATLPHSTSETSSALSSPTALALKKDIGGRPLGPPPPIPFHSKPVTRTHTKPPPTQIYAMLPHSTSETS